MYDAYRFTLNYRSIIEQAPLQTYCSALMFSPSQSILRKVFKSQLPRWVTCVSRVSEHWDSLLQTLEGNTRQVTALKFSPDGQKLCSGYGGLTVCIWDATTGTLLHTLQAQDLNEEYLFNFSFDGQSTAVIESMSIKVWDVMFGSLVRTIDEREEIAVTALSPTETKLASGSTSGTVRVRDTTSGVLVRIYESHAGGILSLEFSPNGQKLASWYTTNNILLIWDLSSASLMPSVILDPLRYKPWLSSLSWNISDFQYLDRWWVITMAFSRNGQSLARRGRNEVEVWDAESGRMRQTLKTRSSIQGLAFLLNGEHLASWQYDGNVQVWDVPTGSLLRTFQGKIDEHSGTSAFSPVGQRLAIGSADGNVQLWDTAFKSPLSQRYQGHLDSILLLVFSPDGQKLASLSTRKSQIRWSLGFLICLWDVTTRSLRKTFRSYRDITSVVFSADGVKLVTLEKNHIVDVWDAESGLSLERENYSLIDLHSTTADPSYGLDIIDHWITVHEKKLIRVPPDRHGSAFATYGTKVAIGSYSGVVTILRLGLELMESSIASCPTFQQDTFVSPGDVYGSVKSNEEEEHEAPEIEEWDMENFDHADDEASDIKDSDMENVD